MAETIAGTGWYNAGQDCTAATRVLAGSKVYDDVLQGLADQAARLQDRRHAGPRDEPRAAQLRASSASASRASSSARPTTPRSSPAASEPDLPGLLPRADRRRRPAPGRRDDPARDLRPGDHGAAVHRRGRGDRVGQRHARTGSRHRSGRATSAARCASARRCASAACGSTTTSRSRARCRTAASSSPATARTSRCTPRGLHRRQARDGELCPSRRPRVAGARAWSAPRRRLSSSRRRLLPAVGRVFVRGRGTCSASRSRSASRSSASSRLRACERASCATAVTRGPSLALIRAFCASDRTPDARTSKTASIRDAVTFACWPRDPRTARRGSRSRRSARKVRHECAGKSVTGGGRLTPIERNFPHPYSYSRRDGSVRSPSWKPQHSTPPQD